MVLLGDATKFYVLFDSILNITIYVIAAYAIILAAFVRDVDFIKGSVFKFFAECIIIFATPALPLIFFGVTRKYDWGVIRKWAITLGTKLVVLHVLITLSGIYDIWFEKDYSIHPGAERQ